LTAIFEKSNDFVIGSHINKDTYLNNNGNPYFIKADLVIDSNATLFIAKGIELFLEPGANIYVNGGLQIEGDPDDPAIIRPRFNFQNKRWGCIYFENASETSIMKNVKIFGATKGIHPIKQKAAISAYNSAIILDNLSFENVDFPIFVQYGSVVLRNSTISTQVTSDVINVKYGDAIVENCELTGSNSEDTDAIDYDGVIDGIIRKNIINGFSGENSDGIDLGEGSKNVLVENNFILNCNDKGISIGQQSTCIIKNNIIANCNQGIAAKDLGTYAYGDHNTLFGNNIAVAAYEKTLGNGGGALEITNSILSQSFESDYYVDHLSNIIFSYSLSNVIELPGDSNIVGNPLFVNPQNFDFRLSKGSSAINKGNPDYPLDPDGSRTDIGASIYDFYGDIEIVINEINYHSHKNFNPEDWIELFNPTETNIDISSWVFKDSNENNIFQIKEGTTIQRKGYYVLCQDSIQFKIYFPDANNYQGNFEFGLKNGGEKLRLYDNVGNLIDSLTYDDSPPWPTEPDGIGYALGLIEPTSDNALAVNWNTTSLFGTPGKQNSFLEVSDTNNVLLENYKLLQNYPNPFNTTTTIKYQLPNKNHVTLIIYDILGRKISTLVNEVKLPGIHEVLFESGTYSSGVYFYRILVGNYSSAKKLMLLK